LNVGYGTFLTQVKLIFSSCFIAIVPKVPWGER